jgi:hypothetical protein
MLKTRARELQKSARRYCRGVPNSASDVEELGAGPARADAPAAAYLLAIKRRPKEVMEAVAR